MYNWGSISFLLRCEQKRVNKKKKKINTKHSIDFGSGIHILRRSFQLKRIYWKIVHHTVFECGFFLFFIFLRLSHERSHSSFIQRIVSLRTAMYFQPTVNQQFFFLSFFLFQPVSLYVLDMVVCCLHCQFIPICD